MACDQEEGEGGLFGRRRSPPPAPIHCLNTLLKLPGKLVLARVIQRLNAILELRFQPATARMCKGCVSPCSSQKLNGAPCLLFARTDKGLALEMAFTSFHRLRVKLLMPPQPSLVIFQFHPCRDCCCFGSLDSRSGGGQFLIGQMDQIHKMDCISEMTSTGVFAQGCLHHEGRRFRCRGQRRVEELVPNHS